MASVDCMSLYSVSTLVGGDDEEIVRAAEERSQRVEAEALLLRRRAAGGQAGPQARSNSNSDGVSSTWTQNVANSDLYSRSNTLSRRDSVSTLVARPRVSPPATNPRSSSYNNSTPSSSAYRTINASALSSPASPDLRVAWWSPIVPNPSLGTSRSSDFNTSSSSSSSNLTNLSNVNRQRATSQNAREQNENFPAATDYGSRSQNSPRSSRQPSSSPPVRHRLSAPSTPTANTMSASPSRSTIYSASPSSSSSPSQRRTLDPHILSSRRGQGQEGQNEEDDEEGDGQETSPCPPQLPPAYSLYAKCYCEENAYILAAYLDRTCRKWNEKSARSTKAGGSRARWDINVVLVSNKNRSVALWQQKAASTAESDYQVVWDYHVFVVVNYRRISEGGSRTPPTLPSSPSSSSPRLSQRTSAFARRDSAMSRIEEEAAAAAAASVASTPPLTSKPEQSWVYDLDSRLTSPAPLVEYLSSTFGLDNGLASQLPKRFQPLFRVIPASDYFTRFGSDRSHMKKPESSSSSSSEWLSPRPQWDLLVGSKAVLSNTYFFDSFVDMRVKVGDGRFGTIVKLEDLLRGIGLGVSSATTSSGSGKKGARGGGEPEEAPPVLAAGVAVLLASLPEVAYSASQDERAARSASRLAQEEEARRQSAATSSASATTTSMDTSTPPSPPLLPSPAAPSPGVIIGGIQRYGMRPPPPPPDGAIVPPNRGKRITDPLFPAYIISAYEHRAA